MLSAVLIAFTGIAAATPGPGWKVAQKTGDLVVFTRDDSKAGGLEVMAVAEANHPPVTLFTVTEDLPHWAEFMPFTQEVRVLSRSKATHATFYERLALPGLAERDGVWAVDRTLGIPPNGGVFRSDWHMIESNEPPRTGVVRLQRYTASWTLEPLAGGERTRLIFRVSAELGGSEPKKKKNDALLKAVPQIVAAVKARADWLIARTEGRAAPR